MTDETTAEFTITRTLDATRDLVWKLWTTEDELAQWHYPQGATTPRETIDFDVRVGGRYRYTMINDETGESYPTGGEYLEVVPRERLVFTWGEPEAPREQLAVATVTFADRGDRTEMVFHLRGYAGHPGDGYVYDGWDQVFDHLADHLAARPS